MKYGPQGVEYEAHELVICGVPCAKARRGGVETVSDAVRLYRRFGAAIKRFYVTPRLVKEMNNMMPEWRRF